MKNTIILITFFSIGFLGVHLALNATLGNPNYVEIRQSYSTGECVAMITYSNEHPNGQLQPCPEVLPTRYKHVWVQ